MQEICHLYKSLYQENRSKFFYLQGKVEELVNDNKVLKLCLTELINKMDSTKTVEISNKIDCGIQTEPNVLEIPLHSLSTNRINLVSESSNKKELGILEEKKNDNDIKHVRKILDAQQNEKSHLQEVVSARDTGNSEGASNVLNAMSEHTPPPVHNNSSGSNIPANSPTADKNRVCKKYLDNECSDANTCLFAHPIPQSSFDERKPTSRICPRFNSERGCNNNQCGLLHTRKSRLACSFYNNSYCKMGDLCRQSHTKKLFNNKTMISSQPTRIYSQPTQQMEKVFQDQQYPQYYKMPPDVPITKNTSKFCTWSDCSTTH